MACRAHPDAPATSESDVDKILKYAGWKSIRVSKKTVDCQTCADDFMDNRSFNWFVLKVYWED